MKVYYVDGRIEKKKKMSLEQMQEVVGGYIEQVTLENKQTFIVNEEGRLRHLPVNPFYPDFVGNIIKKGK